MQCNTALRREERGDENKEKVKIILNLIVLILMRFFVNSILKMCEEILKNMPVKIKLSNK